MSGSQKRKAKSREALSRAAVMQPSMKDIFGTRPKQPRIEGLEKELAPESSVYLKLPQLTESNVIKGASSPKSPPLTSAPVADSSDNHSTMDIWRCPKRGLELQFITRVHPIQPADVPLTVSRTYSSGDGGKRTLASARGLVSTPGGVCSSAATACATTRTTPTALSTGLQLIRRASRTTSHASSSTNSLRSTTHRSTSISWKRQGNRRDSCFCGICIQWLREIA